MVSPATTADSDSDSKPNRPNAPVPITVPSPRAHLHHHHHHLLDHRDTQWARAWEPKGTLRPGAMDGAAKPEAKLVVGEAGYVLEDVPQHRPSSGNNSSFWTTNSGVPVWNNNSAVTVGQRGPILLEDYHLIEKLAQFDKERIHERVVHAQGTSAKGFFQVAHDVSHLMCADFLRAPGVQTPVIVRFSTVMHEREARRP